MKKVILITFALSSIITLNSCEQANAAIICYSVEVDETSLGDEPSKQLVVACPPGAKALGAGWAVLDETGTTLDGQATYFEPSYDGSYWVVNAKNQSEYVSKWKLRMRVTCACQTGPVSLD